MKQSVYYLIKYYGGKHIATYNILDMLQLEISNKKTIASKACYTVK